MPTYEYECRKCKERVEAFQKVSDEPLKECPKCKGPLRRVFHPVGIHFKGSGFHSTDYAKKRPAEKAPAEPGADKSKPEAKDGASGPGADKGADKTPGDSGSEGGSGDSGAKDGGDPAARTGSRDA